MHAFFRIAESLDERLLHIRKLSAKSWDTSLDRLPRRCPGAPIHGPDEIVGRCDELRPLVPDEVVASNGKTVISPSGESKEFTCVVARHPCRNQTAALVG